MPAVSWQAKELPKYRIAGSHEDYGNRSFYVAGGDFLGIIEGTTFNAKKGATHMYCGALIDITYSELNSSGNCSVWVAPFSVNFNRKVELLKMLFAKLVDTEL